MPSISQRTCKECGATYYGDEVDAMFQLGKGVKYTSHPTRHAICNPCKVTARTQAKEVNRFLIKARGTIKHHAQKWAKAEDPKQRWVSSAAELIDRFLWNETRIAHDMEHAWQNGCADCEQKFQSMPGGLHDLTLDIIDRDAPPYYGTNTRFVCTTCNRKKSKTPPNLWGAMKAGWARWNKRQEWLAAQPRWRQEGLWDANQP